MSDPFLTAGLLFSPTILPLKCASVASVKPINCFRDVLHLHISPFLNDHWADLLFRSLFTIKVITNTRIEVWHESALRHQTVCVCFLKKRLSMPSRWCSPDFRERRMLIGWVEVHHAPSWVDWEELEVRWGVFCVHQGGALHQRDLHFLGFLHLPAGVLFWRGRSCSNRSEFSRAQSIWSKSQRLRETWTLWT